jgi:hypothetical protein
MESNSTMTSSAVDRPAPHARVWRDRLQPGTRLLADLVISVQGRPCPSPARPALSGESPSQGIAPGVCHHSTTTNYMDVPPFRNRKTTRLSSRHRSPSRPRNPTSGIRGLSVCPAATRHQPHRNQPQHQTQQRADMTSTARRTHHHQGRGAAP